MRTSVYVLGMLMMVGTCNGVMDTSITDRPARPESSDQERSQVVTDKQTADPASAQAPAKLETVTER